MKKYQTHRVQNKTHTKFKLMRNKLFIVIALLVGLTSINAQERKANAKTGQSEVVYFIPNMHCERCQAKIEKAITLEKGVKNLVFDLAGLLALRADHVETISHMSENLLSGFDYRTPGDYEIGRASCRERV